jgi:hypothetical protein
LEAVLGQLVLLGQQRARVEVLTAVDGSARMGDSSVEVERYSFAAGMGTGKDMSCFVGNRRFAFSLVAVRDFGLANGVDADRPEFP